MSLVSKSKFAEMCGVSRAAISKALAKGAVVQTPNKKIETDAHLNALYLSSTTTQRREKNMGPATTYGQSTPAGPPADGPSKVEADIAKIQTQTAKLRVELATQMGTLIVRDRVAQLFGRLNGTMLNMLVPLGQRVAPVICGHFESTSPDDLLFVRKVIDKEITRAIEQVKSTTREELA